MSVHEEKINVVHSDNGLVAGVESNEDLRTPGWLRRLSKCPTLGFRSGHGFKPHVGLPAG